MLLYILRLNFNNFEFFLFYIVLREELLHPDIYVLFVVHTECFYTKKQFFYKILLLIQSSAAPALLVLHPRKSTQHG